MLIYNLPMPKRSKTQLEYINRFRKSHYSQVLIYLPKAGSLHSLLSERCKELGVSRSELIRRALINYL